MTSERWLKVKEIFNSALDYEPARRSGFLIDACGGDELLRKEVESLISSHEKDGSFIDSPAYELAATVLTGTDELRAGQSFGRYEILSTLGKGGMGEVYLAEDTKLGRKVALKFLSTSFLNDRDRLRRFEQEARAASALNEPNILTIYEIGEVGGRQFIATEYIEGQTLRERLRTGALSIDEAIHIAEQIAIALSAAHAAGIIHRDIKPENVILRLDGLVKILDFGLAKQAEPKAGPEDSTRDFVKTSAGMVMGTVAYMSPEQARGLPVDARTDVWSLGVTLYEMLTGKAPFSGETTSDVLVSVLERNPPPLVVGNGAIPEALEFVVMKALAKERDKRQQTVRELLNDLRRWKQRYPFPAERVDEFAGPTASSSNVRAADQTAAQDLSRTGRISTITRPHSSPKFSNRWLLVVFALVFVSLVLIYIYLTSRQPVAVVKSTPVEILRTTQIPTRTGLEVPALSPDGNAIAYSSRSEAGANEVFVKPLTPGAREIQITSDGQNGRDPAWSPDGKLLAYQSTGKGGIWLVPSTGGTARQLTDFGAFPSWSPDGSAIAFQSDNADMPPTTLWSVTTAGGKPIQLTKQGIPTGGHGTPAWSPDGKRIVFVAYWGATRGQLWTVKSNGDDLKQVVKKAIWFSHPVFTPDGDWIYFSGVSETGSFALYRLRVSPDTGEALGEPEVITDTGLARIAGRLTISADGKELAYAARTLTGDLMSLSVSAAGKPTGVPKSIVESTSYRKGGPNFSRDGKKLAFIDFRAGENQKIWVIEADGQKPIQLATGPQLDWSASWFPDNDTVAFLRDELGRQSIHTVSISTGKDKLLFEAPMDIGWPRLSPDGRQFAFNLVRPNTINVWTVPVEGGQPRQLTFDAEQMGWPCWSPDGKWLALQVKRGSKTHLAIMPSGGGEVTHLASDGEQAFVHDWSPDGDKILFAGMRGGIWNVYWYSLSTKRQEQMTNYTTRNHYVRYPTWSARGDQIAYEYAQTTGSVWLMELK